MGKLRLIFAKEGRAVYISHLDLLRTFQRVFLRQGLVLRHSQGFHPHPVISFAMPLPVGQSSCCEVLDFEVTEDLDGGDLPEKLNRFMPEGVKALACRAPVKPVRDLAELKCEVAFLYDGGLPEGGEERIEGLLAGESLMVGKRTKHKAMADVDIRPMIHRFALEEAEDGLRMEAVVAAQNPGLNPALIGAAVERYLPDLKADFVKVRRKAVLDTAGHPFQ